ncbi:hypothetical protein EUGRSUZ_K00650 [Eucalyptus grandis]|uniref:Uncharacterized protein n=2 Tax=Eucalyptus grandis TaxID=71139 RepID=A0ACC3ISQ9_EUCGR|nr:hypothetical protein EUGRSUZ_K00650 [Eucalyptus grandis]
MARQSGDTKMVRSSLALLQERFKELQRAKERREQREHMRWFPEPVQPNYNASPDRSRACFQYQTSHPHLPSRPAPEDCFLSPGLNSHPQRSHGKFRTMNTMQSPDIWPNAASATSFRSPEYSDVDTSLHL